IQRIEILSIDQGIQSERFDLGVWYHAVIVSRAAHLIPAIALHGAALGLGIDRAVVRDALDPRVDVPFRHGVPSFLRRRSPHSAVIYHSTRSRRLRGPIRKNYAAPQRHSFTQALEESAIQHYGA